MSIITYPLNGVIYDAEDVSTYLCTRTSGVYSKDTNYAVSVTGARQITVAPGLAWINYDDFKAVSACSREAVNLTVPDADSTLPRIDRVVLQFDTAANLTAVKLKPAPLPPPRSRPPSCRTTTSTSWACAPCRCLPVPRSSPPPTSPTPRADEDVCGVMRDGVTGIPTAKLVEPNGRRPRPPRWPRAPKSWTAWNRASGTWTTAAFIPSRRRTGSSGTPYSLPPATADQLGGVKVGEALDIAPDGTLSAKTLK